MDYPNGLHYSGGMSDSSGRPRAGVRLYADIDGLVEIGIDNFRINFFFLNLWFGRFSRYGEGILSDNSLRFFRVEIYPPIGSGQKILNEKLWNVKVNLAMRRIEAIVDGKLMLTGGRDPDELDIIDYKIKERISNSCIKEKKFAKDLFG